MAHFAELDENNIVTNVVVVHTNELLENGVESETKGIDFLESLYGHRNWRQTSYNRKFRKQYAGLGFVYDLVRDAFITPQPFPSWVLDETTCDWMAPVPYPDDGGRYFWDEKTQVWKPNSSPSGA